MPPKRYPADDPREWVNRAASSLRKARRSLGSKGIYPEDICFDCQQCAEKALKGVLVKRRGKYPKTHNIEMLATLIQKSGVKPPGSVLDSFGLTEFAHGLRYPGWSEAATEEDAREALRLARAVLRWCRKIIGTKIQAHGELL